MTKQYNKQWLSDTYKAKLCLWLICEFLRAIDTVGEWGRGIKKISLLEFQQWIGARIPREDDEEMFRKPFSTNINTIRDRNKKLKKMMSKEDYQEHLRRMREEMRQKKF